MRFAALVLALFMCVPAYASTAVSKWASIVKREGQRVDGINSPTPMYLAQIEQESSGNEKTTAYDGGMGLAQFMPATADDISKKFPELGAPSPYNPTWAIRALVRYDHELARHVEGSDDCQRRAAALKSYNAGLGFVQAAQKKSSDPSKWFGLTEYVPTRQSEKNFEYSRMYPRWILIHRQPSYKLFGTYTCKGLTE